MADVQGNSLAITGPITGASFTGTVIHTFITLPYSASVTMDALQGDIYSLTVTNASAHTINAPLNPATGKIIYVTIRNTSGGTMAVTTWNAIFKMPTFDGTSIPSTGNNRSLQFIYNGANWVELNRQPADVPN